ncbi:MAG: VOC family protein [Ornithinimicrobium sp.]
MSSSISHVAINAEDPKVTLAFYEGVFGWRFKEAYPGFFRMEVEHAVQAIAVQQRRDLLPDGPTTGLEEVTIAVPDLKVAVDAAIALGGEMLVEPTVIPGVGELAWLRDPSGNVVGAMAYANGA